MSLKHSSLQSLEYIRNQEVVNIYNEIFIMKFIVFDNVNYYILDDI